MHEQVVRYSSAVVFTPCARPIIDRLCAAGLPGALQIALDPDEDIPTIDAKVTGIADNALVVLVLLPDAGRIPQDIAQVDFAAWQECMAILPLSARVLQALHRAGAGKLTVVCLGLQIALTGSSGMAMMSTVQEGQRSLIKTASRQWGESGFRAHWLGVHPSQFVPVLTCEDVPQKQDSVVRALGDPPSLERIASLLPLLASPEAEILTGATLMAEGGGWMVP